MADLPPFESNLPDARRAVSGGAGPAVLEPGLEPQLVAELEDHLVGVLQETPAGVELQGLLLLFPPATLGAGAQLQWLRAHDRCSAWWSAKQAVALVAYAGTTPQEQTFDVRGEQVRLEDVAREEVAVTLRWTSNYAQSRIDEARVLVGALPQTMGALDAGAISVSHARVIAESAAKFAATVPRNSEAFFVACQALERRVLPVAERQGLSRTRSAANRAVSSIDPAGRLPRRDAAYRGRGVWLRDEPDGVATLIARMAAEHAHASFAAIEQLAMRDSDSGLGVGERRSLALLHLVLGGAAAGGAVSGAGVVMADTGGSGAARGPGSGSSAGGAGGGNSTGGTGSGNAAGADFPTPTQPIRVHVDVIVDLPTLMGLQDNDAEIVGGGSITAQSVRDLIRNDKSATMRRLVTDPTTGHLLDIGRKRYAIPDVLREFIEIRDQRCRFPGCDARAATSEIDHARAWDDGGKTERGNLGALCKRHHQVKTHGGWTIAGSDATGACDWIAPSGQRYAHDAVALDGRVSSGLSEIPPQTPLRLIDSAAEAGVPLPNGDVGEAGDLVDNDP